MSNKEQRLEGIFCKQGRAKPKKQIGKWEIKNPIIYLNR